MYARDAVKPQPILRWSAACGAAAWVVMRMLLPSVGPLDGVLLAAVLVVTPLALLDLDTVNSGPRPKSTERLLLVLAWMQVIAGAACAVSFVMPAGPVAGALVAPWMGLSLLAGVLGVSRAIRLRSMEATRARVSETCFAAALLYFPIGGIWLVASRLGTAPFGFDPLIVLLTAVHFHYAGLAAPVIAGLAIARVTSQSFIAKLAIALAALAVTVGQPLVAAGIAASAELGLAGAVLLSAGLIALAVLTLSTVLRTVPGFLPKLLLVVSSLSAILSMPLAVLWAVGEVTGDHAIDMLWMVRIHGMANAHGFALCGVLAWALAAVTPRRTEAPRPR